jgi:hypothetical protein
MWNGTTATLNNSEAEMATIMNYVTLTYTCPHSIDNITVCQLRNSVSPLQLSSEHFLGSFAGYLVLDKELAVWLDGVRPPQTSQFMSLTNS